ncbi:leucyl aminopeptidase [Hydrogenivirga caldilitoris]|uniref:Probable cytosol aminopeptidase n=1 Tax=Hydrogenivirga caldilitoris TaxID=246264 RepID=A0A497XMK9_9AQUI|nr:leucyl aminopeptidase [Hydrogenivirga caldilitoris]RLJ70068.1 leucyl aminopeptidase [Hydrogenivirga caldilitoris]
MKVSVYKGELRDLKIKSAVAFVYEDELRTLSKLGRGVSTKVKKALSIEDYKGKEGEIEKVLLPGQRIEVVYVIGLGKKSEADTDTFRRASAVAVKRLKKDKMEESVFLLPGRAGGKLSQAVAEGIILGDYSFDKYKSKKEENEFEVKEIRIYEGDEEAVKKGLLLAEAQNYARNLVNEPGNVINPITLAEEAQKLAREHNLKCKVYDEKDIQKMGMLALWSVGKGSATPPRFIHLTYEPKGKAKDRIVIVGKGLTFDSGGLNIKTGDYMRTMKMDKSGACAVLGIMKAIAQLKPSVEVHGIIGAAENMPSGTAYRPDDIIRAKNGKYIEIDNTDAEGRVTLADALSYASELKPSKIIDMATLTGACMVALGEYTAGLFTNSGRFAQEIKEVARETGERVWELPMDDKRLRKKIKKGPADVVNTGGRYGGAITAAMFLEEFVGEGIEWVHLDIAGPAWSRESYGYYVEGGTGFGVRTCLEYILRLDKR